MLHLSFALLFALPFAGTGIGASIDPNPGNGAEASSNEADARQAAVVSRLTPQPWVEGHDLGIEERMQALNVPGVSIAVIDGGRLDWAAAYGVRDVNTGEPVTTETLFQAASISKPVSAMVAWRLAQEGRFDMDAPLEDVLRSFELGDFGSSPEVTPLQLLSHTAGLNVHGFPGYRALDPVPSVVQVLAGASPTNTDALQRIEPNGESVRYSGGGSTLLQRALMDLTESDWATLTRAHVLEPLGMQNSTFEQPLPTSERRDHSSAHGWDGRVIPGRFHTYPEQFAAGLWTTPSDLARFALELQRGLAPESEGGAVLNAETAARMLTPVLQNACPGLFLDDFGGDLWFGHGGANEGFRANFRGSCTSGRGVIVMTNSDQGSPLTDEIFRAVARVYGWEGIVEEPLGVDGPLESDLSMYAGRYGFEADEVAYVRMDTNGLTLALGPRRTQRLAPLGSRAFLVLGTNDRVVFQEPQEGAAPGFFHENRANGSQAEATRLSDFERWPVDSLVEGDIEGGIDQYRQLRAALPDDEMVSRDRLVRQAVAHWNAGRSESGLALCMLVSELVPDDPGVWQTLGQLHAAGGNTEAAIQAYERCLEQLDDADIPQEDRDWYRKEATSVLRCLGA